MSKSLGNVIDPIDIFDGTSLDGLHQKLLQGNLVQNEVETAEKYQKKNFPKGITENGADALRFSLINYTQSSGSDINFDIKTMHGYRKFCNKIYQATEYVLSKLGDDFVPRECSALTGKESLPERWILTKMNAAMKEINQALEERELAKSTQISYRYLYDKLFDLRWPMSLYWAAQKASIPSYLTMLLRIKAWLISRPLTNCHMMLYPCSSPQSSPLVARYRWISISSRLAKSALLAVSFPCSADANVYLEVKDRIQDAGKEAEKFKAKLAEARRDQVDIESITAELSKVQDKDVAEARQSAERRKRDVGATL